MTGPEGAADAPEGTGHYVVPCLDRVTAASVNLRTPRPISDIRLPQNCPWNPHIGMTWRARCIRLANGCSTDPGASGVSGWTGCVRQNQPPSSAAAFDTEH